jgi:hypothetical protein
MSFALALLVLTCGAVAAIVYHLRRAPVGVEDETGFHFSSATPNPPQAQAELPLPAGADLRAALFKAQTKSPRHREKPDSIGIPQVREAH